MYAKFIVYFLFLRTTSPHETKQLPCSSERAILNVSIKHSRKRKKQKITLGKLRNPIQKRSHVSNIEDEEDFPL